MISTHKDTTISNDGATILRLLDIEHPAAKILVDIAKSQDNEVGDGYNFIHSAQQQSPFSLVNFSRTPKVSLKMA